MHPSGPPPLRYVKVVTLFAAPWSGPKGFPSRQRDKNEHPLASFCSTPPLVSVIAFSSLSSFSATTTTYNNMIQTSESVSGNESDVEDSPAMTLLSVDSRCKEAIEDVWYSGLDLVWDLVEEHKELRNDPRDLHQDSSHRHARRALVRLMGSVYSSKKLSGIEGSYDILIKAPEAYILEATNPEDGFTQETLAVKSLFENLSGLSAENYEYNLSNLW